MVAEPQHQRRSTRLYRPRQDEPDGCGVGMPHKCRPSVLQGQGRDAVVVSPYVWHQGVSVCELFHDCLRGADVL